MCECRVRLLTAIYRSRFRNVERDETIHYIIEHKTPSVQSSKEGTWKSSLWSSQQEKS